MTSSGGLGSREKPEGTQGFVQPYTDNPLDGEAVGQSVYLNLINKARKYVYITTPYLIVDNSMNNALCIAPSPVWIAYHDPHIRTRERSLSLPVPLRAPVEAGVKSIIYPCFVHAKNFAVDDEYVRWAPSIWTTAACSSTLKTASGCAATPACWISRRIFWRRWSSASR